MSALNTEQFGIMLHGSSEHLEPGHEITPRQPGATNKLGVSYATPSLYTAKVFAGGTRAIKANEGHVYEVEPINSDDVHLRQMGNSGNEVHHEYVSPTGFRVVKKVGKTKALKLNYP